MYDSFKKIGPFEINWYGVRSVLIHGFLLMLGYFAMQGENYISGMDFGSYQFIVMGINSMVFKFLQKFFTSYGAPLA